MDIETRLRHDLAERAEDIAAAPDGFVEHVLDGHRAQRRHRTGLLALAAFIGLIAVLVPVAIAGGGRGQTAGPTATPSSTSAVPAGPVVPDGRYDLPPRGSLAGDAAFVQGLLDLPWNRRNSSDDLIPDPAADTRSVVFAGAVPGGVQALVIGWEGGGWAGRWLHGAAGAAPADLVAINEPGPVDPNLPMTQHWTSDGVGALVVVGRPGDVVEFSFGQTINANGSIARDPFQEVGDADGVAVIDLTGVYDRTSSLRITRDGQVLEGLGSAGGGSDGWAVGDGYLPGALDGAAGSPDPLLVRSAVDALIPELGTPVDQLRTRVLWGGPIGNSQEPGAVAVVLTLQVRSGAVVLAGWFGADLAAVPGGPGPTYGPCLQSVLPAGTDVAAAGAAMICDFVGRKDGADLGHQLVVLPPGGTAEVRMTGADGGVLATAPVSGPALVAAAPDGVTGVTALDAAGAVTGKLPIRGVQDLRPK
jgi:hypothetical protein